MPTEFQNIEFKESWRDEYQKWICGFANAQGGVLYVGIKDNGEVCGVQVPWQVLPTERCYQSGIERGGTRPLYASQAR